MDKQKHLHHLIIAGIASGLLVSSSQAEDKPTTSTSLKEQFLDKVARTNGNITAAPLTKEGLMLELNQEGADLFESLDPRTQQLALKLASRGCNGENECAGQNACRSSENNCAGQGYCRGKTVCAFSDKNLAVKVAANLAKKRQQAQNQP